MRDVRCEWCGKRLCAVSENAIGTVEIFCKRCHRARKIELVGKGVQNEHPQKEKIAELLEQLDDHQREKAISFLIDLRGTQDRNTPFQNPPQTDLTSDR